MAVLTSSLCITDPDEILRLQGLGWAKRKLIGSVNVTLRVKQFKDDEGVEHVEIEQVGSGGSKGNVEKRILNWEPRENDTAFGPVGMLSNNLYIIS